MNAIPTLTFPEYLLWFALGLVAMAVHELAHAGFALSRGGSITQFHFCLLGFGVQRRRLVSHRDEIACALVGPAVHLALGLLIFSNDHFLHAIGFQNLWMAIWNLVMPHSDGLRALGELRKEKALALRIQAVRA